MKLRELDGNKNMTMIEVAKAVLDKHTDVMHFNDILNEVAAYLELSDEEIEDVMGTFYTDLNTEGSFISLGNNTWGLRAWYPVDSINEEVTEKNTEEDIVPQIDQDGFDKIYEEDEEAEDDEAIDITKDEMDESKLDYDESEESNEEISEYEDELSQLEIEEDDSNFDDEDMEYDDMDEEE